jgi:hypothetical protein
MTPPAAGGGVNGAARGQDREHRLPARQHRVLLRLSTEEHDRVRSAAAAAAMTAAGFAAEAALAAAEDRDLAVMDPRHAALKEALGVLIGARTAVGCSAAAVADAVVALHATGRSCGGLAEALEAYRVAVEHLDAAAAEVRRGLPR